MDNYWTVEYEGYKPEEEGLREALCALGNGYFCTRAALEESRDDEYHYPGTYLAGGYNRLKTEVKGQMIENEDLVNWPNWLPLNFRPEGGKWMQLEEVDILEYHQRLLLKDGLLQRRLRIQDREGRETLIETTRLVHLRYPHLAAIRWKLTPQNWSGQLTLRSSIDGNVTNNGVDRYSDLNSHHLEILDQGQFKEKGIYLKCRTVQSAIVMAQAATTEVFFEDEPSAIRRETVSEEGKISQMLTFEAREHQEVEVVKTVSLYCSTDVAIAEPLLEAQKTALRAHPFEALVKSQQQAWAQIWRRADTEISCTQQEEQMVLRLHTFHLMQTVSFNTLHLDVGVPARGWHGEAYRGHIFWDELFILPLITLSLPELTRSLLMYRYRRLGEARHHAEESGYAGAMFPWQSGSNGREESQKIHLNPKSGNWIPDETRLQMHVNAAIALNVWRYFQTTADWEFLHFYGAEIMLDIHKFWASKVEWDENRKRYEIRGVVGPDEYHTSYPDREEPGLNNNAYTNVMVVWGFKHTLEMLEVLDQVRKQELLQELGITEEDLGRWEKISRNLFVPFVEGGKIISQYEGFEELMELDWGHYHTEYGETLRLDRIMEKEGDDVNRYMATKQADVLMLFFLFSPEELAELLQRCGYNFKPSYLADNVAYYEKRTAHGSTLSKLVNSWVLARSDRSQSWRSFKKALMSDFKDIQGGTTPEGIHLGAMAGTVDLIKRCYTGLEVREDRLWFDPQLPDTLGHIAFNIRYRGARIFISISDKEICLRRGGGWNKAAITVMVKGKAYPLKPEEEKRLRYTKTKAELVD